MKSRNLGLCILFTALFNVVLQAAEATTYKNPRVVIIGAGSSGLTAAYELSNHRVETDVYEGRDRIGGRTNTHYFDKEKQIFFEEGGTTIEPSHFATINLARELNVPLTKRGLGSRDLVIIDKGSVIPLKETMLANLENLTKTLGFSAKLYKKGKVLPSTSFHTMAQSLDDFNFRFLKKYYEQEVGIPFEKAPSEDVLWVYEEMKDYLDLLKAKHILQAPLEDIDEDAYNYTVTEGISSLMHALAEAIQPKSTIHLNYTLTALRKEKEKFILTFDHGGKEEIVPADYVIMTIPFSTLRHVAIDDSVGLSEFTKEAIATLPYGDHSKVGIPLQGDVNLYNQLAYYINMDDEIAAWPGNHTLTLFIDGATGKALTLPTGIALGKKHASIISEMYPGKTMDEAVVKNWSTDPFSRGSYSAHTTDVNQALFRESSLYKGMRAYAEPVDALIFAGEHTSNTYPAYIEGAIQSGLLAAEIALKYKPKK